MAKPNPPKKPISRKQETPPKLDKQPSWSLVKTLFPSKPQIQKPPIVAKEEELTKKKLKKMKCSGSLCSNTKVMHRPEAASSSSSPHEQHKKPKSNSVNSANRSIVKLNNQTNSSSSSSSLKSSAFSSTNFSSSSSNSGCFRGMQFRKFWIYLHLLRCSLPSKNFENQKRGWMI
jgi:hypothetical protein